MAGKPDGGKRTEVAERRAKATALKMAGATWEQVAAQCGYLTRDGQPSAAAALMDLKRFRNQQNLVAAANVEELRRDAVEQIERLRMAYWGPALQGDLKAAEIVLKCLERRARTEGTDAPKDLHIQLEQRTDLEAAAVVEAILAGFSAVEMPPDVRMRALEAAHSKLTEAARSNADVIDAEVVDE